MVTIINTVTGEWVATLNPLTYTTSQDQAMTFDEKEAEETILLLGTEHKPTQRPDDR